MKYTYVMGDIHGRYDLLMKAFDAIFRHARRNMVHGGTIITLGDYVDRGPESCGVIDELMQPINHGWTIVCLQGNHEVMMLETYEGTWPMKDWLKHGGNTTLLSYGQQVGDAPDPVKFIPKAHINWLKSLPIIHRDEHRVYIHAMIDETIPFDQQTSHILQWGIYPEGYGHEYIYVVHGHHQFPQGPMQYKNRLNMDVGAYYTGKLAIAVFDDNQAGDPVDIITVYE